MTSSGLFLTLIARHEKRFRTWCANDDWLSSKPTRQPLPRFVHAVIMRSKVTHGDFGESLFIICHDAMTTDIVKIVFSDVLNDVSPSCFRFTIFDIVSLSSYQRMRKPTRANEGGGVTKKSCSNANCPEDGAIALFVSPWQCSRNSSVLQHEHHHSDTVRTVTSQDWMTEK